jgi:hypothetical protein
MWWVELLNSFAAVLDSGGAGGSAGSFESIATVTLGSNATAMTFSGIPSTYKSLQLRGQVRPDGAFTQLSIKFNSATTNYRNHYIEGTGTAVSAGSVSVGYMLGPTVGTGTTYFGAHIIDIIDYASTTKTKVARMFGGWDANGSGRCELYSGLWNDTAAITSITIGVDNGSNINTGSTFALYGIKGA